MSLWSQAYPKPTIVFIAIFAAFLIILRSLRVSGTLTAWGYILVLPLGGAITFYLIARQTWKLPLATITNRSMSFASDFSLVCAKIPQAVVKNHWKLMKADAQQGHFEVKIGMSLWTYGQTMQIDVKKVELDSTKIDVHCEAPHVITSHARKHNEKMISKFHHELKNLLMSQ